MGYDNMTEYGTHADFMEAIASRSKLPVLECGCGYGSTPLLHRICERAGVMLYSLEHNPEYYGLFTPYESPMHQINLVGDHWNRLISTYIHLAMPEIRFGCVLIDHAPGDDRVAATNLLRDRAEYIVLHDTEDASVSPGAAYGWENVWPRFPYRLDDKRKTPWTTVVSAKNECDWLKAICGLRD